MSFDDFIKKWTNVGIDTDGVFGFQCMDLMHKYCQEVLGLNDLSILAAPTAKDVYLTFDKVTGHDLFTKIDNTPTGVPEKGDIIFWGTGVGSAGHVAVFVQGDTDSFRSFDQNFPTNSLPHIQNHPDYNGVLGWLRIKNALPSTDETIPVKKTDFENMRTKCDNYDPIAAAGYKTLADIDAKISELTKQVAEISNDNTNLKKNVAEAQTNYSKCLIDMANLQQADSSAIDAGLQSEASFKAVRKTLDAHYKEVNVLSEADYHQTIQKLLKNTQNPTAPTTPIDTNINKMTKKTLIQRILGLFGK